MAAVLDLTGLTLTAKESSDFQKFVVERVFSRPELKKLHGVFTGVTMKEQIVLASQLSKTGLKGDSTCTRKTSGAKSTLTQKYAEPIGIEDTIIHCQAEVSGLFKAYYDKIKSYRERYEIEGTDEEVFLSILLVEAIQATIYRAAWLGNATVPTAAAAVAGLVAAGNAKFYNYFNGIWEQVFTAVIATTIKKYKITENDGVTPAAQLTLAAGRSIEIFEEILLLADPRLKAEPTAQFYVTNAIFENYRQYLQSKGENFSIGYTMDGLPTLKWNGKEVVSMETVFEIDLHADFVDNTTNEALYLPNRVLFTIPANIPIMTLNENDFTALEAWYERKDRTFYMSYGFSLDAKVLEEGMIVAAY